MLQPGHVNLRTYNNLLLLVTMQSVWLLLYLLICFTASSTSSTTSIAHTRSPYSVFMEAARGGPNDSMEFNLGPENMRTCTQTSNIGSQRKLNVTYEWLPLPLLTWIKLRAPIKPLTKKMNGSLIYL